MRVHTLNKIFGDNDAEVTPVPIPNTVVKLCSADDTWREAAWESRSSPEPKKTSDWMSFLCLCPKGHNIITSIASTSFQALPEHHSVCGHKMMLSLINDVLLRNNDVTPAV